FLIGVLMMKNQYTSIKKVGIICVVLLLTIALGNSMNKAFAGQDIQSMLMSWFDSKKNSSIEQIDQAITTEKERLMVELREAISAEIQRADSELAQITAAETALRVEMLRSHTADLIAGLDMYDTAEQEIIIVNLNYALQQGIDLLNGTISDFTPLLPPMPGGGSGMAPLPGTGSGTVPKPEDGEETNKTEEDPEANESDVTTEDGQEDKKDNNPGEEIDGETKVPSEENTADVVIETPSNGGNV